MFLRLEFFFFPPEFFVEAEAEVGGLVALLSLSSHNMLQLG